MPAHKLHYRTEFQGLPISIENRKGSKRHWYDVEEEKEGTTIMKFPYGYVRGTLGTDGDAVDVYLGKDKNSVRVFVITQNKAPDFKEIDEQKVMLGFDSPEKAKMAYLAHVDKPGFFRNIKEMSLDDFKAKLASQKGKLIKGALIAVNNSARIGDTEVRKGYSINDKDMDLKKKFKSDAQRKYMYAAADRGEISREVVEEFSDKTPKGEDLPERVKKEKSMTTASEDLKNISKALTAAFANSIARRARMVARMEAYEAAQRFFGAKPVEDVPVSVGIAEEQPTVGTTRERALAEPPVVPVRAIHNQVAPALQAPEVYKSCVGCGRMNKSITCPKCGELTRSVEARPLWSR